MRLIVAGKGGMRGRWKRWVGGIYRSLRLLLLLKRRLGDLLWKMILGE